MMRRIFLAASLMPAVLLSGTAFAQGLARLAIAPGNAYGTHDGVATFGGAMPNAAQLAALRGLGRGCRA